jgi:hypothetical protein
MKSVRAFLSVENLTPEVLQNIRITSFCNEPVEVHLAPEQPEQDQLEPGEALAWGLVISKIGQESVSGSLFVRIDFKKPESQNKTNLISQVVFASLNWRVC